MVSDVFEHVLLTEGIKALSPASNAKKGSGQGERVVDEEEEENGGVEKEGTLFHGNKRGCRESSPFRNNSAAKECEVTVEKREPDIFRHFLEVHTSSHFLFN